MINQRGNDVLPQLRVGYRSFRFVLEGALGEIFAAGDLVRTSDPCVVLTGCRRSELVGSELAAACQKNTH
ncbi:hypothetical protein [Mesorhizobium sp. 43Arga]